MIRGFTFQEAISTSNFKLRANAQRNDDTAMENTQHYDNIRKVKQGLFVNVTIRKDKSIINC